MKSNWTKPTENKITNHDKSVQNNWKLFKEGKLKNLPNHVVEHLNKFTDRALNVNPFTKPASGNNVITVTKKKTTEYSDIITRYEKIKQGKTSNDDSFENSPFALDANISESQERKPENRRRVTLNQLQSKLVEKAEMGKEIDENEKSIITKFKTEESINNSENTKPHLIDLSQNKYNTTVQHHKKVEKDLSHLDYPDHINIPKSILKKGCIYKLNDCYYDDDGEFLYRVPGMC